MLQGVQYAVIGSALYSMTQDGLLAQVGSGIGGNGFVRMCDNAVCLVIILPGTNVGYTYDLVSNQLKTITDPTFTSLGAIDVGFTDSYVVFMSTNKRTLYSADSADASIGHLTFNNATATPRELGSDLYVGMAIAYRGIVAIGEKSAELFIDNGNLTNSPFSSLPSAFVEMGALPGTAYCIAKQTMGTQGGGVYWVANDRTVQWKNGPNPVKASNPGIDAILEHADVTGSYALVYSCGGHPMYALMLPAEARTLVYDTTTTEWHEMESFGLGRWRPLCIYNGYGKQLVGDSQGGKIGFLDTEVFTEWGTVRSTRWTLQPIYDANNRISLRRVEIVLGQGLAPLGLNPMITLRVSNDGGKTFHALPMRSLGTTGAYKNRAHWENCGTSRKKVLEFELSDPVPSWITDVQVTLSGGRF
jgi:hypothetical protein